MNVQHVLFYGISSALGFQKTLLYLLTSRMTALRTFQIFILNCIIFVGSIVLANYLILPFLDHFSQHLELKDNDADWIYIRSLINKIQQILFTLLWLVPMYILSSVLSTIWYQDIADEVFLQEFNQLPAKMSISVVIRDEIYRILLMVGMIIQTQILSLIPYIGVILVILQTSFRYSFYCFDYKWTLQGFDLEKRLNLFEQHWVFMLGFGLPCSIATIYLPPFVGDGFYFTIFPAQMVLAIISKPIMHQGFPSKLKSFPVFYFAQRLNLMFLKFIHRQLD